MTAPSDRRDDRQRERLERRDAAAHDHGGLLDAKDDDWAWRRRIRSNPTTAAAYRAFVFILGTVVTVVGLALVPLPGPGWALVLVGLFILASEFERAQQVLEWVQAKIRAWNDWMKAQPVWLRLVAGLATSAFFLALLWVSLRLSGVPAFLPDPWEHWLHRHGRL